MVTFLTGCGLVETLFKKVVDRVPEEFQEALEDLKGEDAGEDEEHQDE